MEAFRQSWESKNQELNENLEKFYNKTNSSAGTRARKNAQELKNILQNLRVNVLGLQKTRKTDKPPTTSSVEEN